MNKDLDSDSVKRGKTMKSKELLDVEESKVKLTDKAVFSLLQEKRRKTGTFKVAPSATLDLVKQFLPKIQEANLKLHEDISKHPESQSQYDIENTDGTNGPLVEMDVAVYEESDNNTSSPFADSLPEVVHESNIKIPGTSTKNTHLVQEI